jgi:glycosyltransferase involved in cell wall biosynthesis
MIRILHVITGLGQGGAEGMLTRLLVGLDRGVFDQRVVSLTDRGVFGETIEAAGIPLANLGMKGFQTIPRTLQRLRRIIAAYRPDIVQTWLYHSDLLGLAAARLAGDGAVVWNIRCAGLAPDDAPRSTHWLIRLLARFSSFPEAVLFNSVAGQRAHRAIGYRSRVELTIPNGFDLQTWRPDARRRIQFRAEIDVMGDTFLVGMVARHHCIKDHRCFFAAAARIRSRAADVRFVLAGTGIAWSNQTLVSDIDEFGVRDCVILLDSRSDMIGMMAGLDCLVLTSTSEGFPNVIGEAMASGLPCITTDAGDAGLIIADTGKIVPVGDAVGIADGVLALMVSTPQERVALGVRCRARIEENFGIDRVLARYADFYRDLHEQRKRRTSGQ